VTDPLPGGPGLRVLPGTLDGRPLRIALLDPARQPGPAVLDQARVAGCALALVVADEGRAAWERLGFRSLPATETACRARMPVPWPREPAWLARGGDPSREIPGLRPFRPADLPSLAEMHAAAQATQRLRIERDATAWERILGELHDRRPAGAGADEPIWVIGKDAAPDAYVVLEAVPPALRWREHGARAGHEERLVDLFWAALARARLRGMKRVEGWSLPDALTSTKIYPTSRRRRRTPAVMALALDPALQLPQFSGEEECRVWELDGV
jgi:hypothetical protein